MLTTSSPGDGYAFNPGSFLFSSPGNNNATANGPTILQS